MMGSSYLTLRCEIFKILDPGSQATLAQRGANVAVNLLILANVAAVILESEPYLGTRFGMAFDWFEALSIVAFSVEYLLRLWTCVESSAYQKPVSGRLRFALSPMTLMDLAAIVPGYLPAQYFIDLRFLRSVRLIRMLRVLKFARYSRTLKTFGIVFRQKQTDIGLMVLFLLVLVVISSSLMYFVENADQPDKFSSIPAAMWWSVMTLTTVGYGDVLPITPLGKFIGSMIALIGVGFFALPAGVLAAAFAEQLALQRTDTAPKTCPHCGKSID